MELGRERMKARQGRLPGGVEKQMKLLRELPMVRDFVQQGFAHGEHGIVRTTQCPLAGVAEVV